MTTAVSGVFLLLLAVSTAWSPLDFGKRRPVTTAPSSDYEEEILSEAQEAISAGTCNTVSSADKCTGSCYGEVDSVYIEYTDGDWRYVIVNGIPDHTANEGAVKPNPNEACENKAYLKVPANPTIEGYQDSGMGPVALTVTGSFVYNQLSNPTGVDDVAVLNEGSSFDSCDGHADADCFYHYHDDPTCLVSDDDCPLVGYMLDGFPIYGYCTISGVTLASCYSQTSGDGYTSSDYTWASSSSCHLDENNGYTFSDGSYGYVITSTYPYTPPGYMAQPYSVCYF